MRLIRSALLLIAAFLVTAAVRAQSVHWEQGESGLGNIVLLVFENCEPDGDPQLPVLPNASLALTGRSSSMNMINGSVTQSVTLSYIVQSRGTGSLKIPSFSVTTNKGALQVPAFDAGAPSTAVANVAGAKLIPARNTVWAGEVFDLTYELKAARRNNPQINPTFEWNAAPLVAEEWSKPELNETVEDGQRQILVTFRTRASAKTPNTVKLEAASHLMQIQTGSTSFGFLSQPRMEPISVTSDQPVIEVRPLPPPPADFIGAVGEFKLTSKVVPKEAAVGEPMTWTVELTGTGNWPDIAGLPSREVSKDFQVVQPKAKRTPTEHKLFDATLTEDVVLLPTKAGSYTLGPLAVTFFNPKTGRYETLRTERTVVTVTAPLAAAVPATTAGTNDGGKNQPSATTAPAKPLTTPSAPAVIPRDPLPGHATAVRPLSTASLVSWLLSPLAGLLGFWLVLAWRRASRTDPLRAQREAHARLATLLAEMRSPADDAMLAAQLLRWQRDAAQLWHVSHAAPAPSAMPQGGWAELWREADRAIYGSKAALPSDWVARAEAALAAKRVSGFNPLRLFLPQNLLAFAAAVALAVALIPSGLRAVEAARKSAVSPEAAYNAGDFAAAEATWRDAIKKEPTDWIARHDLSLALAQQDRHGEALAQAAAAFVQHPSDPSIRWHFSLAAEKAGFAPAPLVPFLKEGPAASIAARASPAQWQRILIVAAYFVALSLAALLYNAYGERRRAVRWSALAAASVAALLGVVSIFGVVAYGDTADVRAVVVPQGGTLRSIPTEADTTQKTTSLSPGSIALIDKPFLGWIRLVFANGQTGWVRQADVVPLWR